MANIEETELDVPLERVVEHIVGDLPHSIACRRSAKIAEWDGALVKLIAAARIGKLKVSGRRDGNASSEAVRPNDFAEIANNPVADFNFNNEWGGKRILEFYAEGGAKILESHLNGAPTVLWTDVCANSGAEVLRLWPQAPATGDSVPPNLEAALRKERKRRNEALISTRDADELRQRIGAKENQKEGRKILESVQGQRPPGRPRKSRT